MTELEPIEALEPVAGPPDGDWPRLRMVPVDRLGIDPSYQRALTRGGRRHADAMARNFSRAAFGVLIVRDHGTGWFEIIDGQHRAVAAATCGLSEVPALVLIGPGAARFLAVNADRLNLSRAQLFLAGRAAGEPRAVEIGAVLDELAIEVPRSVGPKGLAAGQITCIGALEAIHRLHGRLVLEGVLGGLAEAGLHVPGFLTARAVKATAGLVAALFEHAGDDLDRDLDLLPATLTDVHGVLAEAGAASAAFGGTVVAHGARLLANEHARLGGTEIAIGV